ncbi:MAG TPA: hypothetical protein VFC47_05650 [Caulobacteraceae bacterium]|nr:hypothetical protein [Caulobacteraceae bacterium]
MIRTLAIIALVGFVLSVTCLASAFAIAGGPFSIDDGWRFHRGAWSQDRSDPPGTPARI